MSYFNKFMGVFRFFYSLNAKFSGRWQIYEELRKHTELWYKMTFEKKTALPAVDWNFLLYIFVFTITFHASTF